MASLKDIKRHITAVRQTQKLTKAMNMVAAAKLRSTQGTAERFHNYADEHARLLTEIGKRSRTQVSSVIKPAENAEKVLLVVFTSDRGLCGSYNSNIFLHTDRTILDIKKSGAEPVLYVLGKKGREYYTRRKLEVKYPEKNAPAMSFREANTLARLFTDMYVSPPGYKEVRIVYTKFENVNRRPVTTIPFLPLIPRGAEDEKGPAAESASGEDSSKVIDSDSLDFSMEPDAEELLKLLIPQSLTIKIYRSYLESQTSENAARMQAMDNATKSCKDIIENLTLSYNKARQASVTNELLDIVNGAEALKG
jgi:F-type H+-transporting ATPase subunit gamma